MSLVALKQVEHLVGAESHKFRLPIPPSANVIWRQNHTKRLTYNHPVYQNWIDTCAYLMPRIKHSGKHHWDLDMIFYIYYVHKVGIMDCDNRIKPLVDFIKDRIGIDDRWLKRGSWERINVQAPKRRSDHYVTFTITLY